MTLLLLLFSGQGTGTQKESLAVAESKTSCSPLSISGLPLSFHSNCCFPGACPCLCLFHDVLFQETIKDLWPADGQCLLLILVTCPGCHPLLRMTRIVEDDGLRTGDSTDISVSHRSSLQSRKWSGQASMPFPLLCFGIPRFSLGFSGLCIPFVNTNCQTMGQH